MGKHEKMAWLAEEPCHVRDGIHRKPGPAKLSRNLHHFVAKLMRGLTIATSESEGLHPERDRLVSAPLWAFALEEDPL